MEHLIHHTPTVGSLIKKVIAVNPLLTAPELILIIRQSIEAQGAIAGEFSSAQVVNEEKALHLARTHGQQRES
jgi:hypothetical protein